MSASNSLSNSQNSEGDAEWLEKADALSKAKKFEEAYNLLLLDDDSAKKKRKHCNDVETLWRKARACHDFAQLKPSDKKHQERHFREGLGYAEAALLASGESEHYAAHKWFAVLTSRLADFVSTKEKILSAFLIREHAESALRLKPGDVSTLHMLGRWCYSIASVGWLERKLAAVLFAEPPQSSFDEALGYFTQAHDAAPDWIANELYMGHCHEQLGNGAEAKRFYAHVVQLDAESPIDRQMQKIAQLKL
jgi:tetratricopeptide (TPR) repeat protein